MKYSPFFLMALESRIYINTRWHVPIFLHSSCRISHNSRGGWRGLSVFFTHRTPWKLSVSNIWKVCSPLFSLRLQAPQEVSPWVHCFTIGVINEEASHPAEALFFFIFSFFSRYSCVRWMLLNAYLCEARNKSAQLVIQEKVFQNCVLQDYPEHHFCLSQIKLLVVYWIQEEVLTLPALPKQLHI